MLSYRQAVEWIARYVYGPQRQSLDSGEVVDEPTVNMLSDLCGRDTGSVAQDVIAAHKRQKRRPRRSVSVARRTGKLPS